MKKLKGKKQILLYAISGLGVNMLNLIVGTYLCDALMVEGFSANVENWTYFNKTLVVAGVWSIMILFAKILEYKLWNNLIQRIFNNSFSSIVFQCWNNFANNTFVNDCFNCNPSFV